MPKDDRQPIHILPISRRRLLRSAALGGAGLIGAYLLGCGDGDEPPAPTATSGTPLEPTPGGNATLSAPTLRWRQIAPAGALPAGRHDHSLITDGMSLYLFGGRDPAPRADLWTYDIAAGAWSELPASGPAARFGHNAVWDAGRGRMVVFGGQAGSTFFDDAWEFDPTSATWSEVGATGPAARYGAGGALDGAGRLVITHGFTTAGRFDDTWQLDLAAPAWSDVSPPPDDRPMPRCLLRGVWDLRKNRLLIFGGQATGTPFLDDLWGWSPEFGWQQIARTPRPSARNLYAMVYDDPRTQALIIGGRSGDGPTNDVWIFHSVGESWTQAFPEGEAPSPRYGHDAVVLPDDRILVFGGTDGGSELNDLWELSRTG